MSITTYAHTRHAPLSAPGISCGGSASPARRARESVRHDMMMGQEKKPRAHTHNGRGSAARSKQHRTRTVTTTPGAGGPRGRNKTKGADSVRETHLTVHVLRRAGAFLHLVQEVLHGLLIVLLRIRVWRLGLGRHFPRGQRGAFAAALERSNNKKAPTIRKIPSKPPCGIETVLSWSLRLVLLPCRCAFRASCWSGLDFLFSVLRPPNDPFGQCIQRSVISPYEIANDHL